MRNFLHVIDSHTVSSSRRVDHPPAAQADGHMAYPAAIFLSAEEEQIAFLQGRLQRLTPGFLHVCISGQSHACHEVAKLHQAGTINAVGSGTPPKIGNAQQIICGSKDDLPFLTWWQ